MLNGVPMLNNGTNGTNSDDGDAPLPRSAQAENYHDMTNNKTNTCVHVSKWDPTELVMNRR